MKQSLDNGANLAVGQPNRRYKIDDKNVFNWSTLMVKNLVKILTRISSVSNLKLYIKNKLLYRYISHLNASSQQLQSYFKEQLLLPICTQRKTEITRDNLKSTNSPFFHNPRPLWKNQRNMQKLEKKLAPDLNSKPFTNAQVFFTQYTLCFGYQIPRKF